MMCQCRSISGTQYSLWWRLLITEGAVHIWGWGHIWGLYIFLSILLWTWNNAKKNEVLKNFLLNQAFHYFLNLNSEIIFSKLRSLCGRKKLHNYITLSVAKAWYKLTKSSELYIKNMQFFGSLKENMGDNWPQPFIYLVIQ